MGLLSESFRSHRRRLLSSVGIHLDLLHTSCSQMPLVGMLVDIEELRMDKRCIYDFKCKKASKLAVFITFLKMFSGVKNGRSLQGKLTDGTVVEIEAGASFYTDPSSDTARGGRVRSTTPAEDRYIVLSAKRNRRTTAQQVANQFLAASGKQISRKTVARRLRGGGLYARRPVVCVPLTRQHRTARLQWCREHHNWTEQDWACVLFSDESRFSLSSDCRHQLIWRESGTAYRPENIQEMDRYPTCSIMVWTGIMIKGLTRLHVVANGTMTGQRYIDEVLLPHVRLFRGAVGDKFVFMDDNATCHRKLAVKDCLDSEGIQRLVWPAHSRDLNPIENVWNALGRQVAGRN
ncbi:transposable element Tc1 transposase [Trichonephila clavipes]|nr:transposable element Tc1 transposase [Trichonephila clavipes]